MSSSACRNRAALLRRGRCPHRPALTGCKRDMGISPAGEFLLQRCKRNQKTAGGGSRAFTMPYPAAPRTPVYFTVEPPRGCAFPSGAGKRQDTVPRAARCRSVLAEWDCVPTRGIAPNALPARRARVRERTEIVPGLFDRRCALERAGGFGSRPYTAL